MNIAGISKAKILAALYNASAPQGLGAPHADLGFMSEKDAQKLLDSGQTYFDYLYERPMKIDLSGNDLRTDLYDRDNGIRAAEKAIMMATSTKRGGYPGDKSGRIERLMRTSPYAFAYGLLIGAAVGVVVSLIMVMTVVAGRI